jgi:arsenate reductase (thioredoxin)
MQSGAEKLKVLFLCTGNSCRSQMAEGWTRHLKSDGIAAYSAGVEPHGMNPRAVKAMVEAGVDISGQTSKHIDALQGIEFDYVITLCDHANESCPLFSGKTRRLHMGFDDPPKLASNAANEEEAMAHYRRVRDEIKRFVEKLPEVLLEERQGQ